VSADSLNGKIGVNEENEEALVLAYLPGELSSAIQRLRLSISKHSKGKD
jgi:hypothetical protein